jgi:hypothetical protein
MEITSKANPDRRPNMQLARTYERTWDEMESMLESAEDKRREWQMFFERARRIENRQAMKDAARNAKALEGVIKTLKWTLGEQGIESPLQ